MKPTAAIAVAAAPTATGARPWAGSRSSRIAPGAVADGGEHERADAERLVERDVDEQAEAEAEHGAGHRAGDEAGEGDHQRRQVGRDAEDRHLRDDAELEEAAEQAEQRQPDHGGGGDRHLASRSAWGSVRTCTMSTRLRSAAGLMWMRRSSSPSPMSIRSTRADRDRGRVARLQPARGRAGGVDELALAHLGGVVDELEQQVAGRADGGHDAAGLLRDAR